MYVTAQTRQRALFFTTHYRYYTLIESLSTFRQRLKTHLFT